MEGDSGDLQAGEDVGGRSLLFEFHPSQGGGGEEEDGGEGTGRRHAAQARGPRHIDEAISDLEFDARFSCISCAVSLSSKEEE